MSPAAYVEHYASRLQLGHDQVGVRQVHGSFSLTDATPSPARSDFAPELASKRFRITRSMPRAELLTRVMSPGCAWRCGYKGRQVTEVCLAQTRGQGSTAPVIVEHVNDDAGRDVFRARLIADADVNFGKVE